MKKVFSAIFVFLHLIGFSVNEEVVSSFQSGTSIGSNQPLTVGAVVTTQDGWYNYMNMNNPGYLNFFKIKENSAIVRLRYDDSKKYNPGVAWSLTVTYNIELFDINNTTTPFSTITGETLTINYLSHASPTNYVDIALKKYPNAPKARVTITNVQFTPGGPSIPTTYEDIYLDVIESTERYYVLSTTTPVNVNAQAGFVISNPNGNTKVQLPIAWSFIYGAESYDVEWLFIDVGNNHYTSNYSFNFRNATRVNVPDNHYEIQLAYPAGIILYRVRPVGYDYNGTDLIKVEGAWSFVSAGTTAGNAPSINTAYRYDFAGLDPTKNWTYNAAFTEEGKRKELINYFDGSLQQRQITTVNYEQDNVVITEPILDYEGREAGKIVPTPTVHAGLKYYASGSFNGFNPNYNPFDFDRDVNMNAPSPLPTSAGASKYYSALNNTGGMHSAYIPDAQGYPFTRTTYLTDGTGRLRSQSNVGYDLRTGAGREVTYIYGKPSTPTELDRLFGNEVGFKNNYFKQGVTDENGQTQVTYLDNHGRVIASCLAGSPPSNLYPLDNKPLPAPISVNILDDNNTLNSQNHLVSSQYITVMMPTLHKFQYDINPTNFCKNCKGGYQLCSDCMYDIEISVRDQDGFLVNNILITSSTPPVSPSNANPIIITNVNSGSVDFEILLQPGSYSIDKVLKVNQASLNALTNQFINDQLLNPRCFQYPLIQPESCINGCKSACEERYTRYNFTTQQYYYVDDNEVVITDGQAAVLIANCEQTCKSPQYPEEAGPCTLKLFALKKDMSPGGQYFSNTVVQFTNDPVQGIIERPTYQSQKYDWLNTNLATQSAGLFSAFSASAGVTISSWADVETNWQPGFADQLVLYHPEYCAYKYFCEGQMVCGKEGLPGTTTISIAASNSYDYLLTSANYTTAIANGYFNVINYPLSTAHSTLDFINGNNNYCSYTAAVSPNLDPFIQSECNVSLSRCEISPKNYITNYFKNYLDIGSGNYVSIWYVLDDPDNIHLIATASSTTPPQPIIDFFKQLHGDGTTANPGLFATTSKWDYLKSTYLFYKQLFIYDHYSKYACPQPSVKKPLSAQPQSVSLVHDQFTIHYPKNPIFENLINSSGSTCNFMLNPSALASSFTTAASNQIANTCSTNCSGAADTWMQQLSGCSLTSTQLADIKFYLIEVCKKECNSQNIQGTNGCSPPSSTCLAVAGPGGALFYTFDDVINHFSSGSCQVAIHHPPAFNDVNCSCATLNQYISENGLSAATNSAIAIALNNSFGNATSYTGTDVTNWRNACNSSAVTTTLLASLNYPASFICSTQKSAYDEIGCSCSKISQFINQIGYDPANTANYPYIVSAINNYFALPLAQHINVAQLTTILSNCAAGNITNYSDFQSNNVPAILLCPQPESNSPEDIQEAQDLANCMQIQLAIATAQAVQLYNQVIAGQTQAFQDTYTNFCMNAASGGKESFLMDYLLDEFKYTLYYYDQAGTLVKTVAPEGVEIIVNPVDLQAVADYRNGVTATPFFPAHRMVTRSKYDSYNQKLEHESPDGGLTYYWYDNKGRIVNSQTSRQRNTTPTPKYSYNTFESGSSRITETGELSNATLLTQKIARDMDPALTYAAWRAPAVGTEVQITKTYYDLPIALSPNPFGVSGQTNARNMVTNITYQLQYGSNYDQGIHYSYDVNGIANVYVQENNYLDPSSNPVVPVSERFKTIRVKYTPADRNIHEVEYQDGQADQYYQRFFYDKDNNLVRVASSTNKLIWETDAKYFFYRHSSLARTEYGDKQVQGCDFAYTMQTWLKGLNGTLISAVRDIGKDAQPLVTNINNRFAVDAFAFTNGYFRGDYQSITSSLNVPSNNFIADPFNVANPYGDYIYNTGSSPRDFNLYNGLISNSAFTAMKPDGTNMEVLGNSYIYDQAYRLKERRTFKDPNLVSNNYWTATTTLADYKEDFGYDFNGNMYTAQRDAVTIGNVPLAMDNLGYKYQLTAGKRVNNKLYGIVDLVASGNYPDDIDSQPAVFTGGPPDSDPGLNYWYDENGQLKRDRAEGILSIEYTHFGAIRKINRDPNFYKQIGANYYYPSDVEFFYDANGRRCMKLEIPREGIIGNPAVSTPKAQIYWIYTIYNYDVSGNVAAVYVKQWNGSSVDFRLKEEYVYGSGRTAQISKNLVLPAAAPSVTFAQRELGLKSFELKGNAGNIYSTITDYKVSGFTSGTTVLFYKAKVLETKDYFAFGTPMPNRNFITQAYRYGHNGGSEKDREIMMGNENVYGTYFRELDSRSARWWSMDPVFNPSESPYVVNNNNPVSLCDPLGDKPIGEFLNSHGNKNVRFMIEKDEHGWSYSAAGSAGLSFWDNRLNLSLNLSVRYYEGGLGSTGSGDRQLDVVATPAVALGYALKKENYGRGAPIQQNIFNSYSLFAVDNTSRNSLVYGINFVWNGEGRHQAVAGFMAKFNRVIIASSNDVYGFDGDDRWWTGSFQLGYNFKGKPGFVSFGYDAFTGERILKDPDAKKAKDKYETYTSGGYTYYSQTIRDLELTNGMPNIFLKSTGFARRAYYTGGTKKGFSNPMWLQNFIHDNYPGEQLPRFQSNSPYLFHNVKYND